MTVSSLSPEPSDLYDAVPARRPGGLTTICVIAIILGGLGLLGSLVAIAGLAAGPRLQQAISSMQPQGPGGDRVAEAQRTM